MNGEIIHASHKTSILTLEIQASSARLQMAARLSIDLSIGFFPSGQMESPPAPRELFICREVWQMDRKSSVEKNKR